MYKSSSLGILSVLEIYAPSGWVAGRAGPPPPLNSFALFRVSWHASAPDDPSLSDLLARILIS